MIHFFVPIAAFFSPQPSSERQLYVLGFRVTNSFIIFSTQIIFHQLKYWILVFWLHSWTCQIFSQHLQQGLHRCPPFFHKSSYPCCIVYPAFHNLVSHSHINTLTWLHAYLANVQIRKTSIYCLFIVTVILFVSVPSSFCETGFVVQYLGSHTILFPLLAVVTSFMSL